MLQSTGRFEWIIYKMSFDNILYLYKFFLNILITEVEKKLINSSIHEWIA